MELAEIYGRILLRINLSKILLKKGRRDLLVGRRRICQEAFRFWN